MGWSDPDWNWGSANGAAHDAAARLRAALSSTESREAYLAAVSAGSASWEESKLALALLCQRAGKRCFAKHYGLDEEEQQEWRSLVAEMAACAFEGYRGDLLLADAIGERLGLSESKRLASV